MYRSKNFKRICSDWSSFINGLNAILDKQWMKGAKALAKFGVKGGLAGIAASLTLIYASCIANPNQKI